MRKKLLILGCADRKRSSEGLLPALDRYDGPAYRVLRRFLRDHQWPEDVSIAVLSAKYGLFGILKGIRQYDQKMDPSTARARAFECSTVLEKWGASHRSVHVSLGKDYMPAVQPGLNRLGIEFEIFPGGIGAKLRQLKAFLNDSSPQPRINSNPEGGTGQYSYYLPDWDDLLDPAFNFDQDVFSATTRSKRQDKHCAVLMKPHRISDGILVSLAQQGTAKGPIRHLKGTEPSALSPPSLRKRFGLSADQFLFGDCGAFSYVNEALPTLAVDQAVALYETYGFDFGASVDHIPVRVANRNGQRLELTRTARQARVDITRRNAQHFLDSARQRKASFTPVGTIQGLHPSQYAQSVRDYYDYGYRHLAIGGLVPRTDGEIQAIVTAVMQTAAQLPARPWVHLFGIYRPRLQHLFRELKVDSFDSASYFRKAWLRSDQNYLAPNGQWYAAIRVPMTTDGRTRARLEGKGIDFDNLQLQERNVLDLLARYDREQLILPEVLEAVLDYDANLSRSSETASMRHKYRRTLADRPWRTLSMQFLHHPRHTHPDISRCQQK